MKVLQVTAPGESELIDLPIPSPGPGEVLMRVEAVTTCPQWDLHLRHNEPMFVGHQFHYPYTPGQPGHEATGEVAGIGEGVTGFALRDRISAWRDQGPEVQGCYAHYVLLKADNAIPVPAHLGLTSPLPAEATAPVELAMCLGSAFLMLKEMGAVAGKRFGVTGLGPAGLIAVQMARAEGAAEVIGFDFVAARRDLALSLGASATYDPRADLAETFPARPNAPALDCAIDCIGAKKSVEWLMDRTGDVVSLFGVQREDYTFSLRHYSRLRLCGYWGHSREAADYAVRLIELGKLDLAPLATHHLPLERYNEGIELLEKQEAVKICYWPWRET